MFQMNWKIKKDYLYIRVNYFLLSFLTILRKKSQIRLTLSCRPSDLWVIFKIVETKLSMQEKMLHFIAYLQNFWIAFYSSFTKRSVLQKSSTQRMPIKVLLYLMNFIFYINILNIKIIHRFNELFAFLIIYCNLILLI